MENLVKKPEFYLVIYPNGRFTWFPVHDRRQLANKFRSVIGCDWLEHVNLPFGFGCVVDECGKIKKHPQLYNPIASRLYPGTVVGDPLVGPVIFVRIGLVDGESDWCPLRPADVAKLRLITGLPIDEWYKSAPEVDKNA